MAAVAMGTRQGDVARMAQDASAAEGLHLAAMRAGEGDGVAQDWDAAFDCLLQAAELGHELSQAELAALAGDWPLADRVAQDQTIAAGVCRGLRARIDIGALLASPPPGILSSAPRVATIQKFATPEVCNWLIARAKPKLGRAKIWDPATGGPGHERSRDNSEHHFVLEDSDCVLAVLRARIAGVTELPVAAMEAPAVLHYLPGQQFLPHYDFLDTAHEGYAKEVAEHGQRVVTFLMCLNDDYEGGETQFPALGRRFKGRIGSAIFFWNVTPEGEPDRQTVHAGLPPTRGEKWLLSQWIRERG